MSDANAPDGTVREDAATETDAASDVDATADDAATPSDTGTCTRPDASMGPTDVQCTASPPVFPTFDRSCCDVSDCVVVRHQIDCCGSFTQMGISAGGETAFENAETTCQSQYPRCRCASRPDVADDGSSATTSADVASLRCLDHVCTSTFAL